MMYKIYIHGDAKEKAMIKKGQVKLWNNTAFSRRPFFGADGIVFIL
ncbi:MAG: hypothetical protein BSOLF_2169 [Candidatus Carbobacillus altaicus]|uniref:Uncharacterized protein n=1 Tax=Candidatus Carbonibacillus altaicus TaxID=2163959 RepID=A0A2R6Y373_9BACL|nr:MAG: hypothetical protein BSOLF_2169 [Candidatus Carbobacillus altaicus]